MGWKMRMHLRFKERLNKGLAHGAMELEISSASDKVGNCAPAWSALGYRCGVLAQFAATLRLLAAQ
jgi:hypothetical protein